MWAISNKRCLQLQNKGGYYNTNTNFVRNLILPTRYDCETLDYSLDISNFLQDISDRVQSISVTENGMKICWFSCVQGYLIFSLGGGGEEKGSLFFYVKTFGGRSFQINLTQSIQSGQFPPINQPPDFIPNLVQFPNTQPLRSSDEAFFFFG